MLLVPNIGELESLRYLIANNNHTPSLADQSPRNLVLKLFVSNTTPAEGDVPSLTAYFHLLYRSGTNGYGSAPVTGYPACVNNRTDQDYTNQYGILLNGSHKQSIKLDLVQPQPIQNKPSPLLVLLVTFMVTTLPVQTTCL